MPCLLFLTFLGVFCTKEKDRSILGKWVSISNYTEVNGNFAWRPSGGIGESITFNPDESFSTFIDIPTGGGTYSYDNVTSKIHLNYVADNYGTMPGTVIYKIDELTNTRLIVSSISSSGNLQFRTEYVRLD